MRLLPGPRGRSAGSGQGASGHTCCHSAPGAVRRLPARCHRPLSWTRRCQRLCLRFREGHLLPATPPGSGRAGSWLQVSASAEADESVVTVRAFPHGGGAAEGTAGAPCEHRVPRPGLDAELRARVPDAGSGRERRGQCGRSDGAAPRLSRGEVTLTWTTLWFFLSSSSRN